MKEKFFAFLNNRKLMAAALAGVLLLTTAGAIALTGWFRSGNTKDGADSVYSDISAGGLNSSKYSSIAGGADSLNKSGLIITPVESDSLGVSPTSSFKLQFEKTPDVNELLSLLSVEPQQTFDLKKVSANEYNMEFKEPLKKDSIYRFILSDKNTGAQHSWAFQTKKSLNVIRTLPRDKAVQLPLNSGIEITFSHENIENAEKHFEIYPQTEGRFEQHGNTMVFVPEKLEPDTVYTVTIKKGIGVSGSNDTLENDYTFKFQTEVPRDNSGRTYFSFSSEVYNFTPQVTPALEVYADDKLIEKEVSLELYSYKDADGLLKDLKAIDSKPSWAVNRNIEKQYDETKLTKTSTVKARIIPQEYTYWQSYYLLLPEPLPEGYYLAKTVIDGQSYYAQLQVNSSSVYIVTTEDKCLAWLNDAVTGKALSQAEFALDGGGSAAKANSEGIAVLNGKLPELISSSYYYFIVKPAKGLPFVAQVNSSSYQPYYGNYYNSEVADNYWAYIYLDKGIYLQRDTVNVWGVIKPREGRSGVQNAVLELVRNSYSYNDDDSASVLASENTVISPDGTFAGSLEISNFNAGSYIVRLKSDDKVLLSQYLQVMDYTKPLYKLDIASDKEVIHKWEQVNFDIQASFFEGTPVSGIELEYDTSNDPQSRTVTCDASGKSKVTIPPETNDINWRPYTLSLRVRNKEAEEQQINAYDYVTVFPSDTMIEVQSESEGGSRSAVITTSRIDISKLRDRSSSYFTEDDYRGASVNMQLTAKLYERYYEKKKTGDYYDYINKVKRDTYEYYWVENIVKEFSFNTVDGKYEVEYTPDENKSYYLELNGKDSRGDAITEIAYLYNTIYNPYSYTAYSIEDDYSYRQYKLDENVCVEVKYNKEEPYEGSGRKYLFIRTKDGIIDFIVSDNPVYDFSFEKSLIPNMYVKAVCFDGTDIYNAGIKQYTYDRDEMRLDIEVKPDKESYKPGDTVKLAFSVKDALGKPSSSEISISVVDEAYFEVSPQSVDTLTGLYGPTVSSGILSDYFSYKPMGEMGPPMAEGGEGGDMYVRKDFKDSALFTTVKCGSNGKAEASFKLPDNLTSWRVTYQAVTGGLKAGSGKINVSSKLPFFVDTIFNDAFITGDSPSIIVRSYGTELSQGDEVSYKVVLTHDSGTRKTFEAAAKANDIKYIPLGALIEGNYTIRVEAVSNTLKDALEKSFKVSGSLLETTKTDYINITDSTVLSNNANGLTSLVFYNEDSSMLYRELHSLYCSWGQRLDQKLARKAAAELLYKYFNEEVYISEEFDISKYQTEEGGLALLTYDSSNPSLSAKVCSLAAEGIDRQALKQYFVNLLGDEKTVIEDAAYAYWGLAALKEPVLLEIRELLKNEDITLHIKLILGAALADIGDFQGAREIYNEAMQIAGMVNIYENQAWINSDTRDKTIDDTSLCSIIGLKINTPEKTKLYNYIKSNSSSEILVNVERLIFSTNYIKGVSLDSSFSYELDGIRKKVELKKGSHYRMVLTDERLSRIKFSDIQGDVILAASYVTPVKETLPAADSPMSIKRSYGIAGGGGATFNRSDYIKVTITPAFNENAPDGFYEVTDILPAGFKFIRIDSPLRNRSWHLDEVTGQKVVFGYYYNKVRGSSRTEVSTDAIEYIVSAVTPGIFTADNAAICNIEGNAASFSERDTITIEGDF